MACVMQADYTDRDKSVINTLRDFPHRSYKEEIDNETNRHPGSRVQVSDCEVVLGVWGNAEPGVDASDLGNSEPDSRSDEVVPRFWG